MMSEREMLDLTMRLLKDGGGVDDPPKEDLAILHKLGVDYEILVGCWQ